MSGTAIAIPQTARMKTIDIVRNIVDEVGLGPTLDKILATQVQRARLSPPDQRDALERTWARYSVSPPPRRVT